MYDATCLLFGRAVGKATKGTRLLEELCEERKYGSGATGAVKRVSRMWQAVDFEMLRSLKGAIDSVLASGRYWSICLRH